MFVSHTHIHMYTESKLLSALSIVSLLEASSDDCWNFYKATWELMTPKTNSENEWIKRRK